MEASQAWPMENKTYRLRPWFLFVYRLQGVSSILFGAFLLAFPSASAFDEFRWIGLRVPNWAAAGALFAGAVYLFARAARSVVTLNPETVSVKRVWSTRSLSKNAILGFKATCDRGIPYTTLLPKSSAERPLAIEMFYAFDGEWNNWISDLPNLDKNHTLGLT